MLLQNVIKKNQQLRRKETFICQNPSIEPLSGGADLLSSKINSFCPNEGTKEVKQLRSEAAKRFFHSSIAGNEKNREEWRNSLLDDNSYTSIHPYLYTSKKKAAFTLAEVLITLGIIGVVAAVSMPILIQNVNERANSERDANIAYKITQAVEKMRALGYLNASYATTEAFVDELQNHLKIAKRCDSNHIAECWPTSTVIDTTGKEYDVSKAKTGKDLQLKTETKNVGLVLADGGAIILNYDPTKKGFDVGDAVKASRVSLPVGGGKSKEFAYTTSVTDALAYVVDVNGKGGPNSQETDKKNDIRSFNGAKFGTGCAGKTTGNGKCVYQIASYSAATYPTPCSQAQSWCVNNDHWQGAIDACKAIDMKLPTKDELLSLYGDSWEGKPTSGWFWSSSETYTDHAWGVSFGSGTSNDAYKGTQGGVLCVGK